LGKSDTTGHGEATIRLKPIAGPGDGDMTFGIGFIARAYAGIVTDRQISGARSHEDSDKCGAVAYQDGRFVYTFAGLAEAPTFDFLTRERLAEAICRSGRPDPNGPALGVQDALRHITSYMTEAVSNVRVPLHLKATSILFAGFRKGSKDRAFGELHLVSNFESIAQPRRPVTEEFSVDSLRSRNAYCAVSWIGSADLPARSRTQTLDLLERSEAVNSREVVKGLVREVRSASERTPIQIGRQCSSIVVSASTGTFDIDYHSDRATGDLPVTAYINAVYGNEGAHYTFDERLSSTQYAGAPVVARVGPVHKRQSCPCGSGRRYKNCHGNPRAMHVIDGYSLSGHVRMMAMPDDGSPLVLFSNDVFKR
jgi:hypothetical protein